MIDVSKYTIELGWKRGQEYLQFMKSQESPLDRLRKLHERRITEAELDIYWDRFNSKRIDRAQYKHPKWQKLRLLVFQRDEFKCTKCGETEKMLHAHHLKYIDNVPIWDVPIDYIITLCEDCHSDEHNRDLRSK